MTASGRSGERIATGRLVEQTRPAVDSASVLLVRDGHEGLEVFMLERHIDSDFAGGAYAFPGGKVDAGDLAVPDASRGDTADGLLRSLGAGDRAAGLGLCVAAVRETFEEAGVLLAARDGRPVDADDLTSDSFVEARSRLAARGNGWDWRDWLAGERLVLDLGALAFFSWWVTPHGLHKRYSTRFFLVEVPPSQAPALRHDDIETTDSRWSKPQAALAAQEAGEVTIVYPTRQNLRALARHRTAGEAWSAAAATPDERRRLQPEIVWVDSAPMILHPDGGTPETP